jgi:hypothetical protein
MSDTSTAKAVNWVNLEFRGDMAANRVTGGYVTIDVQGNNGNTGTLSGTNFTANVVGSASITKNDALSNGGRAVGIGWSNPANNTLTVTAKYFNSSAVEIANTVKQISIISTTSLEPCKPCDPTQIPVVTILNGPLKTGPGNVSVGIPEGALRYLPSIIGAGYYLDNVDEKAIIVDEIYKNNPN